MQLQPGQVWCWGSQEHASKQERLWLLTEILDNRWDGKNYKDAVALDLEAGELSPVFNLPIANSDEDSYIDAISVMWRRVL